MKVWKRVRALGDSASVMRRDDAALPPRDEQLTWVDRVADALDAVSPGRASGAHSAENRRSACVRSFAREGARVADVVERQVPLALTDQADLVFIMAGTHELLAGRSSPETLADRVDASVAELRGAGSDVVLISTLATSSALVPRRRLERSAEFTSELWWIARARGATVVDAWSIPDVRARPLGAVERVTLDAAGHRMLARRVIEALGVPYRDGLLPPVSEAASRLPG